MTKPGQTLLAPAMAAFALALVAVCGSAASAAEPPALAADSTDTPMTFESALGQVMLHSPDLRKYAATAEAAEQEVMRARSPFLPRLDVMSTNQRIKTFSNIPGLESLLLSGRDKIHQSSSSVRLSLNVFNGGADLAGLRQAREKLNDAELQLRLRRVNIAARVLDQFHAVVQTALELRAAELQLSTAQSQVRRAQDDLAEGRTSSFAVTEAQYDADFKELSRASKARAHRNAQMDLLLTLGAADGEPAPGFELRSPRYGDVLQQFGFADDTLAREVEIFDSRVRQSRQEIERSKARFLPKLEVFYKTDFSGLDEAGYKAAWDTRSKDKNFIGFSLTWNLFDGFDSLGEMRAAARRLSAAQAESDIAREEQRKRVAEASRPLHESHEDAVLEHRRLDMLQRKLELNRLKHELGKLDARSLEQAHTDVAQQELELQKREESIAYYQAKLLLTQGVQ